MTARFSVNHLKNSKFRQRGLRGYFEYRDLGIKRATKGRVVAHVIRARPGKAPYGECLRAEGLVLMKAGSCFYQPPRIRHRELKHSTDLEMIEIVSPASFKTVEAKPAARRSPGRRSPG